jgi:DNA replication licensing factor MCM6
VSFNGTVTRTTEVRPELLYGRFLCGECGVLSPPIEQQFKYTEPTACLQPTCNNRMRWTLDMARSRFADWQRLRVQENADEIPPGSMPRTMDVVLRHGAVDKAKAGDKVFFTGALIVIPDIAQLYKAGQVTTSSSRPANGTMTRGASGEGITGMKDLGVRDLTYRVAFLAQSVARGTPDNISAGIDDDENAEASAVFTHEEKVRTNGMLGRQADAAVESIFSRVLCTAGGVLCDGK